MKDPFYVRLHTLPQLDNLRSFTFGAHHRFDKYQLLNLLSKVPNLTDLDIYYDDFLNVGPRVHSSREPKFFGFASMKNLIVRHQGVGSLGAYTELFRWVKLVASRSPLTGLSIIADDERECRLLCFKATRILLDWIQTKPDLSLLNIPYVQLSNADLQWAFCNSDIKVLSMYFSTAEMLVCLKHIRFTDDDPIMCALDDRPDEIISCCFVPSFKDATYISDQDYGSC